MPVTEFRNTRKNRRVGDHLLEHLYTHEDGKTVTLSDSTAMGFFQFDCRPDGTVGMWRSKEGAWENHPNIETAVARMEEVTAILGGVENALSSLPDGWKPELRWGF